MVAGDTSSSDVEREVLDGPRRPHWECPCCGSKGQWASRIVCRDCRQPAPEHIRQTAASKARTAADGRDPRRRTGTRNNGKVEAPADAPQLLALAVCLEQLGKHLVAAVARDFDEAERKFGSLPALSAAQIVHVARVHLNGLVLYQQELGNALAQANREGEEARREERMRIWGYA